jgi:redox-sensitive bicupin YhaK (pirin superfamily)
MFNALVDGSSPTGNTLTQLHPGDLAMLHIRHSKDRGQADHGWLQSQHTFSFADYHDPQWMGWGNLRVINEDRIAPGTGFGTHGHRDMEIISYVVSGALAHKDNMGNTSSIPPGDVQRMSAGRGVMHSEFNHAVQSWTHFFQIWILPNATGMPPSYEQKTFADADKRGLLRLVAAPDAAQGSVKLHADARIYASLLDGDAPVVLPLAAGRKAWVQVIKGTVTVNGTPLQAGDAAGLANETQLTLSDSQSAEVLVFDLAA